MHSKQQPAAAQDFQPQMTTSRPLGPTSRGAANAEAGGPSNTPPPASLNRGLKSRLSVVCDTAYISGQSSPTLELINALQIVAKTGSGGQFFLSHSSSWKAKECRLKGWSGAYQVHLFTEDQAPFECLIGLPDGINGDVRVMLMLGSKYLWKAAACGHRLYHAISQAFQALVDARVIARLPWVHHWKANRIDLAVDAWGLDWSLRDCQRMVTRAKTKAMTGKQSGLDTSVIDKGEGITFYLGNRGTKSRMLRVYNKTAEAKKRGKLEWMAPAWEAHGWDGQSTVWRFEVEHGGQWLKSHGFGSPEHWHDIESALWEHYTHTNWQPSTKGHKNTRRRSLSRKWQTIQPALAPNECTWQFQSRKPTPSTNAPALLKQALGCAQTYINSLAEWERTNPGTDIDELLTPKEKELRRLLAETIHPPQETRPVTHLFSG